MRKPTFDEGVNKLDRIISHRAEKSPILDETQVSVGSYTATLKPNQIKS